MVKIIKKTVIGKKQILSMFLAVLMIFLQLPTAKVKVKAAGGSSGIDLNSTTGWTQVYAANEQNDFQGDQQTGGSTNSVSQDIVGNVTNPSTYMKISDDKTEFAVRIRVNNCNGTAANPQFSNFTFVGIDGNGNGTIDFFLGVYNPTGNNGRLGIYNADTSSLNTGPSTTGISGKPLLSFAPVKDVNYSIIQASSNIFNDPDYFITYKFKISDISNAILNKTKENVTFTADTPFRFITGTAAQDNSFNQDISGMGKDGWGLGKTWLELSVFSPVVSVNGGTYYTVTFDKNTGDTDAASAMKIIQGGSSIGTLPTTNPTKRGMYFQEWNTKPDGTGTIVNSSTVVNTDFKAYAVWSSKPVYTVTFQGNGGNFSDTTTVRTISTINGVIGDNMPITPTYSGNYFIGWGTDKTLNKSTIYDSQTSITGNITLYALWDNNIAKTATFYNNIGTSGGKIIATIYPNPSGQTTPPANPTREGYSFGGWYDNINCTGTAFTGGKITSNMTYYAKWTPVSYILTYNENGGTLSGSTTANVTDGKFAVPTSPTRSGYIFIEWNLKADGTGEPMYSSSSINANTTVYAIWQENVAVTFNANGGAFDKGAPTAIDVKNKKLTALPIPPSREGYTFLGWSTSAGDTVLVSLTGDFNSSTILYAVWSPVYKVNFYSNGGAWSGNETQTNVLTAYGNVLYIPDSPSRTGYTFASWNTAIDGKGTVFDANTEVTGNVPVYAKWNINSYTVSFDSQGGNAVGNQSINYNEKASKPSDPTRTGYSFGGWYKDSGCTSLWNFATDTVTGNTTLYAKWNDSYTVTFNSNGGTDVSTVSISNGNVLTKPTDPTKTGYSFIGWYKEAECIHAWNFATDTVTGNTELYAKWYIDSYNVSFDSQGGSIVFSQSINYNDKVSKPGEPTKIGYSFGGWYKDLGCTNAWDFATDTVTGNTKLYAKWAIDSYIVSFDSQGGSTVGNESINYNEKALKPMDPTKTGYSFVGWYKEAECIHVWDFTTDTVIANTKLYAKWAIDSYIVSFDSQGGSIVFSQSINYNDKVSKPGEPTKIGYSFGGWYKEAECIHAWNFATDTVAGNTKLYAKWNINSYNVSFDSQGGSTVGDESINYNEKALKPTDPTKTGYSFVGWYKDSGSTNAWDFATDTVTGNTKLYAKWAIDSYIVSFDSQGGSIIFSQSINYNDEVSKPGEPTKIGYSFGGWYKEAECIHAWNFATDTVAGNTKLYAKWNINSYNVSFDSQGGSPVGDESINYNEKALKPTDPTKTGYSFGGWYREVECTSAWNFNSNKVTGNTALYAKWNLDSYMVKGDVKDDSDSEQPVPEVKVSIESAGNVVSGPVYTDSDGKFEFYGIPAGIYNLVIVGTDINGNKVTITQIINITGDTQVGTVKIPLGRKSSIFVHKGEVSVNTVGKLNEIFNNIGSNTDDNLGVTLEDIDCVNNGGEAIVRLEANLVDENTQANQISDVKAIINENSKYLGYLVDLSVYKDVTPLNGITKTSKLKEINNLVDIYISLPSEIQGKKGYAVYRYHEGKVDIITETPNERGERIEINGNTIILTVQKFSVYAIAYDKQNANNVEKSGENNAIILPKTGSIVDFNALMSMGSLLSIVGIILLRRKK